MLPGQAMLGFLFRDAHMRLGLYIIGDEILSGKRQDKHFPHVLELLKARRMRLDWAQYLGDDPVLLAATFQSSFSRGDVALSCGGIGATPDDHTRQSAARALGLPLELHPEARVLIQQRVMRGAELLTDASVTAAFLSADGRPQRQPREWVERFKSISRGGLQNA